MGVFCSVGDVQLLLIIVILLLLLIRLEYCQSQKLDAKLEMGMDNDDNLKYQPLKQQIYHTADQLDV